ncbi:glycosyltransferase [Mycobacterium phage JoieB]|uniref:Glycosyltransferase n=2 Tax=Marvinvirus marvin TaxID=1982092 RepID=A0A385UHQ5_9CAUD|nr:glycosyltransferase [Mycobacterium phage VasuNzinga]QFP94223.1 glycosyltransferase [Mycobacterium phage JoieB]
MLNVVVIIPFRDRGRDPLRQMNLDRTLNQWACHGFHWVVSDDGRSGNDQFNRSAAYNRAVSEYLEEYGRQDVFIFAEADMIITDVNQVEEAIRMAGEAPGLVVPFDEYRYYGDYESILIRKGEDPSSLRPMWEMKAGRSIGAINVVSAETLNLIGQWDERFEGNWYDDDAMKIAFDVCAGPTRWVEGPAHHLYHLPGHRGGHLSREDKAATRRNQTRLGLYREAARQPGAADRIRDLTMGRR